MNRFMKLAVDEARKGINARHGGLYSDSGRGRKGHEEHGK